MGLPFFSRRTPETSLRLPRRELAALQRWLAASAGARLAETTIPLNDRRDAGRHPLETMAELRPISAGGIGQHRPAVVRDVSAEGIALLIAEPLARGQRISIEIQPPPGLRRRALGRLEKPIELLAVVRYCRAEGDGHVAGCSIGVDWADSLANEIFPAGMIRRKSA